MRGLFYYLEHNTMPIPTAISELSKVASENSPAGTESVKGTIDDYLRAGFAFLRQLSDLVGGPTVVLASAATVNIGFAGSANVSITGTTAITAFDTIAEGTLRWVTFAGALTLTHNATSLQLPGTANIVTAAGDVAAFKSLGAGNWKCLSYTRIGGEGVIQASTGRNGFLSATDWNTFNGKQAPLGYTPVNRAGDTVTGAITFANNVGLRGTDAVGAVRTMLYTASDNNVYICNVGGANIRFTNSGGGQIANLSESGVFSAPVITETSDERKKKCWKRLPGDLIERLASIKKSGTFRWKKGDTAAVGTGAQSLEAILPEAVYTDDNGDKTVNTGGAAMAVLVEVARELMRVRARLAKLEAP
jgi:hypothetical protein